MVTKLYLFFYFFILLIIQTYTYIQKSSGQHISFKKRKEMVLYALSLDGNLKNPNLESGPNQTDDPIMTLNLSTCPFLSIVVGKQTQSSSVLPNFSFQGDGAPKNYGTT